MKARSQAGIVAVLILLGGYVIADAVDIAPGVLTAADKPLEPRAYPEVASYEVIDADVPQNDSGEKLSAERIEQIAQALASDPRNTGSTSFVVRDLDGNVVYDMSGSTGRLPASSIKILTASAALYELGPTATLPTTTVLSGDRLFLVGGGDIYLSPEEGDSDSIVGHAGLADLADQTAEDLAERGTSSVVLTVDSSAFAGADYHENVQGTDRVFIMPMRPIAVDGGALDGTYVANPDIYAAEVFAELLTERGITVTSVTTGSAPEITDDNTSGVVYSAPVRELVDYMLTMSDNSLAEVLGHLVAAERGLVPDFDGSARGVYESLVEQGFSTTGVTISDTAGLSIDNRVTGLLLTEVLTHAGSCSGCEIASVPHGLPISGFNGTLASRFEGLTSEGLVRAKTGTLIKANSLSGYFTTGEGETLAFSILIDDIESGTTGIVRPAMDEAIDLLVTGGEENAG